MNPLFMMFGPMGFMGGGCGCGVNMPYYGQNDMLTFMNFPVFRNTSNDYLLDPRLAMWQAQQNWMNGGSFGMMGSSYLPLFNNFPGMAQFPGSPWFNPTQSKPETEEEKKKREAKEAEAKKPEAKKAENLKKAFDNIKKLSESKKNFVNLDESIVNKAKEAMEKETASERLTAMKEVMKEIPDSIIKKSVLADDVVAKKLKEAGYNFNYKNNLYSLPSDGIIDNLNDVHNDISSKRDYVALGKLAANTKGKVTPILSAISSWNNTQKEKGILNFMADNMPEEAPMAQYKEIVQMLADALLDKADEYTGCEKIKQQRDKVAELKDSFIQHANDALNSKEYEKRKSALSSELKALSKEFETLYARLRMQEAQGVSNYINSREEFTSLNEVKEGLIDENIVVAETYANLKEEGISNVPSVEDLDEVETPEVIRITSEGVENLDDKYKDKQELLECLRKDKKVLTKVGDSNVYQTKTFDGKDGGSRYFTVQDNKLVEVFKQEDGSFKPAENAEAVSSNEILEYDKTVKRVKKLLEDHSIEGPVNNTTNLFKATGANEYYALVGNKFGKVKATADSINVNELTEDNLEEFNDTDVTSKKKIEEEKKAKENKDVTDVGKHTYPTYASLNNEALSELGKEITGKEDDFEETHVKGYYYCKSKKRFYKYNQETGKLDYLKGVTKIAETGYMIKDGKWLPCTEIVNPENYPSGTEELKNAIQDYAKKFAKDLNGKTDEKEDIDAKRRLNTFTSFTEPEYIVNFIKGYKAYGGFWSNSGMCKQIVTEYGFKEGTTHTDKESKRYYIKWIAIRMKEVVNRTNFSKNSDEYKLLEQIARGELLTKTSYSSNGMFGGSTSYESKDLKYTAEQLDKIIDKIIEAYDEKQSN